MGKRIAATASRLIQPAGHSISQKQRHRDLQEREDKFVTMLADMQKKRERRGEDDLRQFV